MHVSKMTHYFIQIVQGDMKQLYLNQNLDVL